jgi:hypothetical protein
MAAGDRAAFAEFYDVEAPLAFALIRRILGQRTDAEEVLQEVFWQVWQEASSYRVDRGSPEAWVLARGAAPSTGCAPCGGGKTGFGRHWTTSRRQRPARRARPIAPPTGPWSRRPSLGCRTPSDR